MQADLHVYTGSQIQTHQSINGFLSWLNDVNQTLVSADLVLITRDAEPMNPYPP